MNRKQRRLADRIAADKAACKANDNPAVKAEDKTRAAINRQNAQASTGPVTESGKETSKMNALKHGLTAQNPVLPTENMSAYEAHKAIWLAELKPVTFGEKRAAQIILDTEWRLKRIPGIEDKLAAEDIDAVKMIKALDNLSRHEARLRKAFDKACEMLAHLKEVRRNAERRNELANQKQQNGFVLQKYQTASNEAAEIATQNTDWPVSDAPQAGEATNFAPASATRSAENAA